MRYGTRTRTRKKWGPRGHRPECPVHIGYEWGYLYAAICPYMGEMFCMLLPNMTKVCFEIFMQQLEAHLTGMDIEKGTLFLDRASNHKWKEDGKVKLCHLPAASPELNPVERFFQEARRAMDGKVYMTIEEVEEDLTEVLHQFYSDGDRLAQLTWFTYLDTPF